MKRLREMNNRWLIYGVSGALTLGLSSTLHFAANQPAEKIERQAGPSHDPAAEAVSEASLAVETAAPTGRPSPLEHPLIAAAAAQGYFAPGPQNLTPSTEGYLSRELSRLLTRDAQQLVTVISGAVQEQPMSLPLSFLLSIAYVETHGRILAVSPAGAVGLAQAMPQAYLLEGFDRKIFVTNDYLVGNRAFIMKKPLADAMRVATVAAEANNAAGRNRARALLASAKELRTEGMEELTVLEPYAPPIYMQRIEEADRYNEQVLNQLEAMLDRNASAAEFRRYHTRLRGEYRSLMNLQRASWDRYYRELTATRDQMLRQHYGIDAATVMRTRAYEAGEFLGENLDARFSPTEMARFLGVHLESKMLQAAELGVPKDELEAWTAALYNGGALNVKRMRAGLMTSLRETQNYMKKVPELRTRLDRIAAAAS
jgi:hypothetical protein